MPESEQPWTPSPDHLPFAVTLLNPQGNRHLGFDTESGFWHRLWQHRGPQRLHAGKAMFLRPADVDQIIKISCSWIAQHRGHQRTSALTDEIATGAKQLVIAFAEQAGARAGVGYH